MDNNNNRSSGDMGIFTVVGNVFIILKLCKVINWSWIWILSPFWIPIVITIAIIIIGAVSIIIDKWMTGDI